MDNYIRKERKELVRSIKVHFIFLYICTYDFYFVMFFYLHTGIFPRVKMPLNETKFKKIVYKHQFLIEILKGFFAYGFSKLLRIYCLRIAYGFIKFLGLQDKKRQIHKEVRKMSTTAIAAITPFYK